MRISGRGSNMPCAAQVRIKPIRTDIQRNRSRRPDNGRMAEASFALAMPRRIVQSRRTCSIDTFVGNGSGEQRIVHALDVVALRNVTCIGMYSFRTSVSFCVQGKTELLQI